MTASQYLPPLLLLGALVSFEVAAQAAFAQWAARRYSPQAVRERAYLREIRRAGARAKREVGETS